MDTTFTFRTDESLKTQASAILKETGLDLSTALNLFMKATVKKNKFPLTLDFDIEIDPINTYPDYFFKLAGKGKNLVFDDVEDSLPDEKDFELWFIF